MADAGGRLSGGLGLEGTEDLLDICAILLASGLLGFGYNQGLDCGAIGGSVLLPPCSCTT